MSKILIANGQISSSDAFSLVRGTTNVLTISGSNVGIGTTNPLKGLHIYQTGELLRLADYNAIGNPYLSFYQTTTRRAYIQLIDSDNSFLFNSEYGPLRFYTGTAGGNERMRITSGGNVGIGTTNPSVALDVIGAGKFSSTLQATTITPTSHLGRSAHHTGHLVGGHNNIGSSDLKSNPIYTIGSNFNPSDAALGNMYGIGYTAWTATFINSTDLGMTPTSGWGMYVAADGNARIFFGASTGHIYHKGNLYTNGLVSGSTLDISSTIKAPNIGTGTDNSVVILNSSGLLKTDEINSKVWSTSLGIVDATNGASTRIATFSDSDTVNGDANLTWDGSTMTVTGDFRVTGRKNFWIDNPKTGKKLTYDSLEGPSPDVFFRGTSTSNIIELPEDWKWLVSEESLSATLTPVGKYQQLYIEKIEDNKIYVSSKQTLYEKIKSFFIKHSYIYNYNIIGTRKDIDWEK